MPLPVRELVGMIAEGERLLPETLAEEKTDKLLCELAEAAINAATERQAAR